MWTKKKLCSYTILILFFDGKKVDLSEINSDYHKDLPFAEFHQNVEKDTKIKIIIFGEIGEKGFTEELSLSRGE